MTPRDDSVPPPRDAARLQWLVFQCCEGALTPAEHDELEQALRASRDARRSYTAAIQVDAALDWRIRGRQKLKTLAAGAPDDVLLTAAYQPQCDDASASVPVSPATRVASRRTLAAVALLAASLFIALGAVLWLNSTRQPSGAARLADARLQPLSADGAVATIVELPGECRWFVENRRDARGVARAGDTIRLTRGQLKIEFSCGATVTMRSPAALQVISPMQARAVLGTLTAHVGEGAEGFTVETPRTTVVDLGTDFGIDVSDHGSTDVVVFNGEVDLHYDGETGLRSRQRLRAGEGIRVSGEGTASRIVSIVDSQYAVDAPLAARTPVISAVTDNIRRGESWHYYEIVHGGLREDAKAFVDRKNHEWNGVTAAGIPAYLLGGDYVKTFNDDKMNTSVEMRVTLDRPAILYVLLDNRTPAPEWLRDEFYDTGDDVGVDGGGYARDGLTRTIDLGPGVSIDDQFSIWRRDVPAAGVVDLGAIMIGGEQNNMYGVVAVPMELHDGEDDFAGSAERPADATASLTPSAAGVLAIDGSIERPGDVDAFSFPWRGGAVQVACRTSGHATLDPVVSVFDRHATLVGYARSDHRHGAGAAVTMKLPPGDYFTLVAGGDELGEVGAYRLEAAATLDDVPPPLAPSPSLTLNAAPTGSGIALSWDPAPASRAMTVERSSDGVRYKTIATTTAASAIDDDVEPASVMIYRLRSDDGSASAPLVVATRPPAVEKVAALGRQPRLIVLQWRDPAGQQAYRVERSIDGRQFTALATTAPNACGFRDTVVEPGTKYFYRVTTLDGQGDVATSSPVAAASAVGAFTASAAADGDVALRWQANHPAGKLLIERQSGSAGAFVVIAMLPGAAETYVDRAAPASEQVFYRVVSAEDNDALVETAAAEVNVVRLPGGFDRDHFAVRFTGMLRVEQSGRYDFTLKSDDGVRLFVNGQLIISDDGCHPVRASTGGVELAAGVHDLEIQYFEYEGQQALEAWWSGPGVAPSEIPASALSSLTCRCYDGPWKQLPFTTIFAVSPTVSVTTPPGLSDGEQILSLEDASPRTGREP